MSAASSNQLLPLCFNKEAFVKDDFSVDTFIADCRRRVPLESVLVDLRHYASSLENDLVELINKDYADFVNLSANLSGIDKVIENLRAPLNTLLKEVSTVSDSVHAASNEVQDILDQRRKVQQNKLLLQRFLLIHQTLSKVEHLLEVNNISSNSAEQKVQFASLDRETVSNLLQRVANDLNQLHFHVGQVGSDLPFVKLSKSRIHQIEFSLQTSLRSLFVTGLQDLDAVCPIA